VNISNDTELALPPASWLVDISAPVVWPLPGMGHMVQVDRIPGNDASNRGFHMNHEEWEFETR